MYEVFTDPELSLITDVWGGWYWSHPAGRRVEPREVTKVAQVCPCLASDQVFKAPSENHPVCAVCISVCACVCVCMCVCVCECDCVRERERKNWLESNCFCKAGPTWLWCSLSHRR